MPDKHTENLIRTQPKSRRMILELFNKETAPRVEDFLKQNPKVEDYEKVSANEFEIHYSKESTAIEASKDLLPITNGNIRMKAI